MKNLRTILFVGMIALTSQITFADSVTNEEKSVYVGVTGVFVPSGFDSNSDVNVVINGILPNGCYRYSHAEVAVRSDFTEVKNVAMVQQGMCLMVLVPYTKEVNLGKYPAGKHMLRFIAGDGTYIEKELNIEE